MALPALAPDWSGRGRKRTWPLPDDTGTLLRNLAGLTGLALLATPLVGGRLSWIAPVTLAMAA